MMRARQLSILSLLLACCFAVAPLAAQNPYQDFVKEWGQAQKFNNVAGMKRALTNRPYQAVVHWGYLMASWLRTKKQDEKKAALDNMKSLFAEVHKADTLDHLERYYMGADQELLDKQREIDEAYNKAMRRWGELQSAKDADATVKLAQDLNTIGRRADSMGNRMLAGKVYILVASIYSRAPVKQDEQATMDAIAAIKDYLAAREAWNFTFDREYATWKNWRKGKEAELKAKEAEGKKLEEAGIDKTAEGLKKRVDPKGKVLSAALEFSKVKKPHSSPFFMGGEAPQQWMSTQIQGDSPAKMLFFKRQDLYLKRVGNTKIEVCLDPAGKVSFPVDIGPKPKISHFWLDEKKTQPYAMMFFYGSQNTPFGAGTSNLAPNKDAITVYYRSVAAWECKLGDTDITLFDDTGDGKLFVEDPMEMGITTRMLGEGGEKEIKVAAFDAMQIGRDPVQPLSSLVQLKEGWFKLEAADGGKAVAARPLHPDFTKFGKLQLKWKGSRSVKPAVLIVRGTGELATVAFNLAKGKAIEVPTGKYEIAYGRAFKGKGAQMQVAHIFKGDSQPIEVEEGKTAELTLGAPFTMDFAREGSGDTLRLDSLKFRVLGAAKEVYCKIIGPVPAPEVVVTKNASGRGAKAIAEYVALESGDLLNTAAKTVDANLKKANARGMGVNVAYFPVVKGDKEGSTILEVKLPFSGALIGLRVKKNKLFGKIEATYKK